MAKAIRNKGVTQQVVADNYVVYALRKAKPIAAYITTVTDDMLYILIYGKLPEESKCKYFIKKVRIPGGDISGVSYLPDGLSDTVSLNTLFSNVRWGVKCGDMDEQSSIRTRVPFFIAWNG